MEPQKPPTGAVRYDAEYPKPPEEPKPMSLKKKVGYGLLGLGAIAAILNRIFGGGGEVVTYDPNLGPPVKTGTPTVPKDSAFYKMSGVNTEEVQKQVDQITNKK